MTSRASRSSPAPRTDIRKATAQALLRRRWAVAATGWLGGVGPTTPGNPCLSANPLSVGATSGSTASGHNDFRFTDVSGCQGSTSYTSSSNDAVYVYSLPAGMRLTVRLTNGADGGTLWDSTLNLLAGQINCGINPADLDGGTAGITCVAAADDPQPQTLSFANSSGSTVQVYVIVDGYSSGARGSFMLETNVSVL